MGQFSNVPDVKDAAGLWLRSYRIGGDRYHTRGGKLWASVETRTKVAGQTQKDHPTYTGTTNDFEDFQDFVDWCRGEYGYTNQDSSGFWHIDKDILSYGNKSYSRETCIFVPQAINKLVLENLSYRGDLPIGVSRTHNEKYRARCKHSGVEVHIGVYDTPEQANLAWTAYKISVIREYQSDSEIKSHKKLVAALNNYIERLEVVND